MALEKCPNCGQEISDKALKCIHCGLIINPNNKSRKEKSAQQLYDEACKYYRDLILTVKRIGLAIENIENINYSTEIALNKLIG